MKLLPRRNAETTADVLTDLVEHTTTGGKGRATPKRRDSAVQRGPVSAPKTRKEALARQKQQAKAAKVARKHTELTRSAYHRPARAARAARE